jgi:hypothetical protein
MTPVKKKAEKEEKQIEILFKQEPFRLLCSRIAPLWRGMTGRFSHNNFN